MRRKSTAALSRRRFLKQTAVLGGAAVGAAGRSVVAGLAHLLTDGIVQAHLSLAGVLPAYRRRGIARRLLVEAFAVSGTGARLSQIAVDHDNPLIGPSQRDRPLAQRVLTLGALAIFKHLLKCRLPDVEIGVTAKMIGGYFL